ncbi:MAG: hypothetical protein NVSMB19_18210 [Vulcanimicrobiaceae bacterium]
MYDTVIELATHDGIPVVSIASDVDVANAGTMRRYLEEAAGTHSVVILSLAKCNYIDSSGLRPVFALADRLGDGFFIVVPRGTYVRRIFNLVASQQRMNLCASIDEAINKATKGRPAA